MKIKSLLSATGRVYQRTTLLQGTMHLLRGTFKMLRVLAISTYWMHSFAAAGKNFTIHTKTTIDYPRNIRVGDDFCLNQGSRLRSERIEAEMRCANGNDIGMHVHIDYSGSLTIGDRSVISDGASIHTHSHGLDPHAKPTYKKLTIGKDVWIGGEAMILPQVSRIGDGAVIGARAVVTKDVAPYTVVAGNPARVIRELKRGRRR